MARMFVDESTREFLDALDRYLDARERLLRAEIYIGLPDPEVNAAITSDGRACTADPKLLTIPPSARPVAAGLLEQRNTAAARVRGELIAAYLKARAATVAQSAGFEG